MTQLTRSAMEISEVAQCEFVTVTWYSKPHFVLVYHEHLDAL